MPHAITSQMGWGKFSQKNIKNFTVWNKKKKKSYSFLLCQKNQRLHQGKNTQLILLKGPGETQENILQCW